MFVSKYSQSSKLKKCVLERTSYGMIKSPISIRNENNRNDWCNQIRFYAHNTILFVGNKVANVQSLGCGGLDRDTLPNDSRRH